MRTLGTLVRTKVVTKKKTSAAVTITNLILPMLHKKKRNLVATSIKVRNRY